MSYAKLWTPETVDGKAGPVEVYSTALLIDKNDKATIKAIEDAIAAAKVEGKPKLEVKGKMPSNLRLPLHDGDEEKPDDPAYAGCYFFNAKSYAKKPMLVERKNGLFVEITNPDKLYSGCYVAAIVDFYAYDNNGKGITSGLKSVAFIEDGEPLSGSVVDVEEGFKGVFDDDFLD